MHEVRIFDGNERLKEIISGERVSELYWGRFSHEAVSGAPINNGFKRLKCRYRGCRKEFDQVARDHVYCIKRCQEKAGYLRRRAPESIGKCANKDCGKEFKANRNRKYCWDPCKPKKG